jgi:hypothetical protein
VTQGRRASSKRSGRATAAALALVLAAGFALPLLAFVLLAAAGPDSIADPGMASVSTAALGGIQRMLHAVDSVRLDPIAPLAARLGHPEVPPEGSSADVPVGAEPARSERPDPADASRRL